jgi:1-acyl-sn-glycerol-3-phosphate acyltransferase
VKRETLLKIILFLLKHITDTRYEGLENLPLTGGIIVATNHMSRVDIPVLFANPVRPEITALVADKYVNFPIIGWLSRVAGAVFIDRDRADFGAFRVAQQLIKDGIAMGIAPEGTRSNISQLNEGKSGTVLLALKTKVPIVPVGLAGTEDSIKRLLTFRKPHIVARFGKPFTIDEIPREKREEALQKATDEVMCRIAALLPKKYWGFYKDHPRLKELIAEQGGPVI